jgi:hypothetical protein
VQGWPLVHSEHIQELASDRVWRSHWEIIPANASTTAVLGTTGFMKAISQVTFLSHFEKCIIAGI